MRISFDDGNTSDIELGLPALLDRNFVGSFFVVAGRRISWQPRRGLLSSSSVDTG